MKMGNSGKNGKRRIQKNKMETIKFGRKNKIK